MIDDHYMVYGYKKLSTETFDFIGFAGNIKNNHSYMTTNYYPTTTHQCEIFMDKLTKVEAQDIVAELIEIYTPKDNL